jgi:hypothetical protein
MFEHAPVLSNLLSQGLKPLRRFHELQLPLWIDEGHDISPIEQHERSLDRVIAHKRAASTDVETEVHQEIRRRAGDVKGHVIPVWFSDELVIDVKSPEGGQRFPRLLCHSGDRSIADSCAEVDVRERIHVSGRIRPLKPARENARVRPQSVVEDPDQMVAIWFLLLYNHLHRMQAHWSVHHSRGRN